MIRFSWKTIHILCSRFSHFILCIMCCVAAPRPSLSLKWKILVKISFYYSLIATHTQTGELVWLFNFVFIFSVFRFTYYFAVVLCLGCAAWPCWLVVTMMIITHFTFFSFVAQSVEFWNEMNTIVINILLLFFVNLSLVRQTVCSADKFCVMKIVSLKSLTHFQCRNK